MNSGNDMNKVGDVKIGEELDDTVVYAIIHSHTKHYMICL